MKIGVAISTYANENTDNNRLLLIKKCLDSLLLSNVNVLIVNDGSTNEKHIKLINSYPMYTIINKSINGGIAKSKNTAIRFFDENDYDYIFLMDDDMIILDKDFYSYYIDAIQKTGIHHFCYKHENNHKETINMVSHSSIKKILINAQTIKISNRTNGCFLTLTKQMIKDIGYFKVLPYKYGHEHSNYTQRAINNGFAPGYVDIIDSEKYIGLQHESGNYPSSTYPTEIELKENFNIAFSNVKKEKYITCIE